MPPTSRSRSRSRRPRVVRLLAAAALTCALATSTAAASAAVLSSNWAGYVSSLRAGARAFRSVSGTWVLPTVSCAAPKRTYSAVWVGLGGSNEDAKNLEQVGTEANCLSSGTVRYGAWYEIVPAAPVAIHLDVSPGDTITASTTVVGRRVTFRLRDVTTGASTKVVRRPRSVDVSSAEWIVEAPSACTASGDCTTLPLAAFGTVQFTDATASATAGTRIQTAVAGATLWSNAALELEQASVSRLVSEAASNVRAAPMQTVVAATPSATATSTGAFSVAISEQSSQVQVPEGPTLPGYGP